jgi:hypothetical protein
LHVEAGVQCLAQSERSIPGLPGLKA